MADIFISYARADREKVEKLASALEGEGYSVWWDRHIQSGSEFSKDIEAELDAAKAVVVCWSKSANQSRWVKDEANAGAEAGKLLAVTLDGEMPPMGFRQFHCTDFAPDEGAAIANLKRSLATKLGREEGPPETRAPATLQQKNDINFSDPKVIGGAAVGLLAIVLLAFVLLRQPGATTESAFTEIATHENAIEGTDNQLSTLNAPEKSIAVLPFVDMTAAGDQQYFSDGMAEEILNALARAPGLKVAGRTSSFAYKNLNMDMREIGAALNVFHILEGSVRKQGERVRITAQLIRADDGFHLWSETYDGTLEDIFDLQETISRAITSELEIILNSDSQNRLAQKLTNNQVAYDLFLQGRELTHSAWGPDALPAAVSLLEQAVALDPAFVQAWETLSLAYYLYPQYVVVENDDFYMAKAREVTETVLTLDPGNPDATIRIGGILTAQKNYLDGHEWIKKGTAIAAALPNHEKYPHEYLLAYNLSVIGRTTEAVPLAEIAVRKSPNEGIQLTNAAVAYFNNGDIETAEILARNGVEVGFIGASGVVADILDYRGEREAARDYLVSFYDQFATYSPLIGTREDFTNAVDAIFSDDKAARDRFRATLIAGLGVENPRVDTALFGALLAADAPGIWMTTFEKYTYANSAYALSRIWDDRERARNIRQHKEFPGFAERIGLVDVWNAHGWPDKCEPLSGTDGSDGNLRCN